MADPRKHRRVGAAPQFLPPAEQGQQEVLAGLLEDTEDPSARATVPPQAERRNCRRERRRGRQRAWQTLGYA
ncbi:hypothetical protein GN956_G16968 [Arapaima gigas]